MEMTQLAVGLLKPLLDSVNMVNAPVIARERDITVTEVKTEGPTDYQTLIPLTVKTERRERTVAGTLFGGRHARVVQVQDIAKVDIKGLFQKHDQLGHRQRIEPAACEKRAVVSEFLAVAGFLQALLQEFP